MAATSCHGRWQRLSAELMTVSARWYAASAAEGMPEVEAVATAWWALVPAMPGATAPGTETLAGASIAWVGTRVPSGRAACARSSAEAALLSAPTPARLAVQAADNRASGTSAVARWRRPKREVAIVSLPVPSPVSSLKHADDLSNDGRTERLRGRGRCDRRLMRGRATTGTTIPAGHDAETCPVARDPATWPGPPPPGPVRTSLSALGDLGDNGRVAPSRSTDGSAALFARAHAVTPGGVNSPVRAFNAVGGTPRFIRSARGAWLTDVDGNEYIDLICSWGPMLLGHAHPEVQAAVAEAIARGTSYGAPTEPEVELAEEIVARTPVERVRFVSSGTEATMSAIRLARGFTGRDVIVKFAGCYHGHVDSLLASAGSGLATFGIPGTPGVPAVSTAATLVLPHNQLAAVERAFAEHGDQIACVITEAAAGNMGAVAPVDGFNAGLARLCRDHGALFVSDEVMTGFRAGRSGYWGIDGAVEGWKPDLMTFGKVMGGGFPA